MRQVRSLMEREERDAVTTARALRASSLFADCSDDDLERIAALLDERTTAPGAWLVREGEPATELFLVRTGAVEVTKRAESGDEHRLATLGPGASFGELTFVDRGPRSASVRALDETTVAVLSMADLDRVTAADDGMRARMLRGLAGFLAQRLRGVSEVTATALQRELELAETRVSMATFLTYVILVMVGYGFAMRFVADLAKRAQDTTFVSVPIVLLFAVPLYAMMRRSGEPLATYGLTLRGGRAAAWDALVWSMPLLLGALVTKIALVLGNAAFADAPIFAFGGLRDPSVSSSAFQVACISNAAYLTLVPMQELIARGALQTPLARFLVGRHATTMAIVIANALFTASHLYLSTTFALLAMVPGFVFGWLYARHGTLVAPIVAHVVLGAWSFFVLGFDRMLV